MEAIIDGHAISSQVLWPQTWSRAIFLMLSFYILYVGEIQYGVITFDMTLGVNKSLELNVTELTEFLANELKVDVSQV